ncbi:MAG: hypothetical protein R2847_03615 [Bacteroidia bacterium]
MKTLPPLLEKRCREIYLEIIPDKLNDYKFRLEDNKLYSSYVVNSVKQLDSLYKDTHFLSLTNEKNILRSTGL